MSIIRKRILLISLLIGLVIVAVVISFIPLVVTSPPIVTLNPEQMTDMMLAVTIPPALPLSDEDVMIIAPLREQIEACSDYNAVNHEQALANIDWIIDLSDAPSLAFVETDVQAKATFISRVAQFTYSQWQMLDYPVESCLIDIGHDINLLLEAVGRESFTEYDETE